MPTRSDNATAVPAAKAQFDPEVVDIASYVHNSKISSDLAVSIAIASACHFLTPTICSSTPRDGSSSTLSAAV